PARLFPTDVVGEPVAPIAVVPIPIPAIQVGLDCGRRLGSPVVRSGHIWVDAKTSVSLHLGLVDGRLLPTIRSRHIRVGAKTSVSLHLGLVDGRLLPAIRWSRY